MGKEEKREKNREKGGEEELKMERKIDNEKGRAKGKGRLLITWLDNFYRLSISSMHWRKNRGGDGLCIHPTFD